MKIEDVGNRIVFNRMENERYFQECMIGMTKAEKVEFQMRLLDAMFSVIEAIDFKKLCNKSKVEIEGSFIQ